MNLDLNHLKRTKKDAPPWPNHLATQILFPSTPFCKLLEEFGYEFADWVDFWEKNGGSSMSANFWSKGTRTDWIWGLGFPLLSEIQNSYSSNENRQIIGISALPGCGKSSLGNWLEAAAMELEIPITVISMDDFYLPADQLEKAMFGNPWNVPRALPGSHDLKLFEDTLVRWIETGELIAPQFDKALRNGLGNRSGWIKTFPKVLVLEGWFLGCKPIKDFDNQSIEKLDKPLTKVEINYRRKVQLELEEYCSIWDHIEHTWHIKAEDHSFTSKWKTAQEKKMFKDRGSSLKGEALDSFLRMIQVAIPQSSLTSIDSDVLILIDQDRHILWSGRTKDCMQELL